MTRIFTEDPHDKSRDDNDSVALSAKETSKKKPATKSKKGAKGKGKKDEMEETPEEQAHRILAEIAEQRRKQAEDNLYPEPDEKIFMPKSAKRMSKASTDIGGHRLGRNAVMPRGINYLGYNKKIFQQQIDQNERTKLKVDKLR